MKEFYEVWSYNEVEENSGKCEGVFSVENNIIKDSMLEVIKRINYEGDYVDIKRVKSKKWKKILDEEGY